MACGVIVDEDHSKLPRLYLLPKLHKRPYKSRFILVHVLLLSCLYFWRLASLRLKPCYKILYNSSWKEWYKLPWFIKNSGEILNNLKSKGFLASSLYTYDFSTLYTTLPHNLIKENWTKRAGCFSLFVFLVSSSWLLCGSFAPCHGFICSLWLWYFLIILTYYFCLA